MSDNFDMQDPSDYKDPSGVKDNTTNSGGMSRNTKIILGIVGGLLALCCVAAIIGAFVLRQVGEEFAENIDNPEAAAETAATIVNYKLPPGFTEEGGFSFVGIDMVMITNQGNDAVIMLMSFPKALGANEEDMQQQMDESMSEAFGDRGVNFQFVEAREVVINDQNTVFNIFEGTDDSGVAFRQATAIFESNAGKPAMIMIMSPTTNWEGSNLDAFIDSLN